MPLTVDSFTVTFEPRRELAVYVTTPDRPGRGHRMILAWEDGMRLDREELERRAAAVLESLATGRELGALLDSADRARRERETHEAAAAAARESCEAAEQKLAELAARRDELAGELAGLELARTRIVRERETQPAIAELDPEPETQP